MIKRSKLLLSLITLPLVVSCANNTVTDSETANDNSVNESVENLSGSLNALKQYNKHDIISKYENKRLFYYSTGIFEVEPYRYDGHMATMSMILAEASNTYVTYNNNVSDFSNGDKKIKEMYEYFHFGDFYSSEYYKKEPQPDSVGYAIGKLRIWLNRKEDIINIISVTIRSGSYGMEWASNVTLGDNGEAKGFKDSADIVKEGIDQYLEDHHLMEDLYDGKVIFWVQGFSRGGAIANLTSKRLIDDYQEYNTDVYGYCLEAPQGGVKKAEVEGKDYRGIHNVINPNDIVPYVAPSVYGFKRYGVDHYLFDWAAMSDDLIDSFAFPNNKCDNKAYAIPSDDLSKSLEYMLKDLVTSYSMLDDYRPHQLDYYTINIFDGISKKMKTPLTLADFLKKFMDTLALSCTREKFANDGLQTALRRLMTFVNGTDGISDINDAFGWWDYLFIGVSDLSMIIPEAISIFARGIFDTIISIFIDGHEDYLFDEGFKEHVADKVKNALASNDELKDKLEAKYPGGKSAAYTDFYNLTYYALGGLTSVNEAVTLIFNIQDTLKNHTMIQTLGWLQAQDDWYPGSIWNPK